MVCELTPSDIESIKRTKALMMAAQDIETLNREFRNSKFMMEDMATQIRLALHNKSTRPHLSPHRIEFLNKCMAQLKQATREMVRIFRMKINATIVAHLTVFFWCKKNRRASN